ncbi:hypothetical protein MWH25_03085 [Natroniella acetigena]|uniref:hypothetical protein n=1 Tax=Natroniella acetigena TaxID=52004 RepID=UPI00200B5818|nr:hypothetical protein [Natroniella acetigena]MCK8826728.1 hypothetical protein [Natroniella acetigena]
MEEYSEEVLDSSQFANSTINNSSFTIEEIDFLLNNLSDYEVDNSLSETEQELIDFLVIQLEKLKKRKEEERNQAQTIDETKVNSQAEELESSSRVERCKKPKDKDLINLKRRLEEKRGEFLVVNVMTGGDCCQLKGVLCDIADEFITLIDKNLLIYIKIEEIASIKRKVDSFKCYQDISQGGGSRIKQQKQSYTDDDYQNQFSFEQVEKQLEDDPEEVEDEQAQGFDYQNQASGVKINKAEKFYTDFEE